MPGGSSAVSPRTIRAATSSRTSTSLWDSTPLRIRSPLRSRHRRRRRRRRPSLSFSPVGRQEAPRCGRASQFVPNLAPLSSWRQWTASVRRLSASAGTTTRGQAAAGKQTIKRNTKRESKLAESSECKPLFAVRFTRLRLLWILREPTGNDL